MQITSSAFNRESAQVQYLLPSRTQWQRIRSNSVQERCHARAAFGNSIFKEWKGSRYTIYIYTPCTSDRPFMARRRWERRLYKKQSYDKRYRRCKDCSRAAKTYVFWSESWGAIEAICVTFNPWDVDTARAAAIMFTRPSAAIQEEVTNTNMDGSSATVSE